MAKSKKASGAKPIADVAHPGTTAPSDTSKPIITQRPMIKDPMMVEESAENTETPPVKRSREARIAPPKESKQPAPKELTADKPEEKPEPKPEKKEEKPTPEPPAPDPEPEKAVEAAEDEPEDSAAEDTPEDKKPSGKKSSKTDPGAETAAASAQDAKMERLINSKKYFLPINAVEHRRSRRVVIAGVILAVLLTLTWVNVALDAGIIEIDGINPVIRFFSN